MARPANKTKRQPAKSVQKPVQEILETVNLLVDEISQADEPNEVAEEIRIGGPRSELETETTEEIIQELEAQEELSINLVDYEEPKQIQITITRSTEGLLVCTTSEKNVIDRIAGNDEALPEVLRLIGHDILKAQEAHE